MEDTFALLIYDQTNIWVYNFWVILRFDQQKRKNLTDKNLYTLQPTDIVFYGTSWCGDCRRARVFFEKNNIKYIDVDLDHDPQAETFVKKLNRGFQSVPTIVFPDGTILVEPTTHELETKISLN